MSPADSLKAAGIAPQGTLFLPTLISSGKTPLLTTFPSGYVPALTSVSWGTPHIYTPVGLLPEDYFWGEGSN